MIKAGGGSAVNVSSLLGLRCIWENPGFCSSKGGLINLTQQGIGNSSCRFAWQASIPVPG